MSGAPFLCARSLGVALGGREVLHDVSLELRRDEFTCVVGPNGAGKTTLLRALAGLGAGAEAVTVAGQAVRALRPAERARRVAYLPQSGAAAWPLPVADVVALGRMPHGGRLGRLSTADALVVADALARTDLASLAGRSITALSGGERARALLARALAVEADALLADERSPRSIPATSSRSWVSCARRPGRAAPSSPFCMTSHSRPATPTAS